MAGKNGKKIFLGALSAIAASVAAGTMIKNKISEKNKKIKKKKDFIILFHWRTYTIHMMIKH